MLVTASRQRFHPPPPGEAIIPRRDLLGIYIHLEVPISLRHFFRPSQLLIEKLPYPSKVPRVTTSNHVCFSNGTTAQERLGTVPIALAHRRRASQSLVLGCDEFRQCLVCPSYPYSLTDPFLILSHRKGYMGACDQKTVEDILDFFYDQVGCAGRALSGESYPD
jgi:hypothetical protein